MPLLVRPLSSQCTAASSPASCCTPPTKTSRAARTAGPSSQHSGMHRLRFAARSCGCLRSHRDRVTNDCVAGLQPCIPPTLPHAAAWLRCPRPQGRASASHCPSRDRRCIPRFMPGRRAVRLSVTAHHSAIHNARVVCLCRRQAAACTRRNPCAALTCVVPATIAA